MQIIENNTSSNKKQTKQKCELMTTNFPFMKPKIIKPVSSRLNSNQNVPNTYLGNFFNEISQNSNQPLQQQSQNEFAKWQTPQRKKMVQQNLNVQQEFSESNQFKENKLNVRIKQLDYKIMKTPPNKQQKMEIEKSNKGNINFNLIENPQIPQNSDQQERQKQNNANNQLNEDLKEKWNYLPSQQQLIQNTQKDQQGLQVQVKQNQQNQGEEVEVNTSLQMLVEEEEQYLQSGGEISMFFNKNSNNFMYSPYSPYSYLQENIKNSKSDRKSYIDLSNNVNQSYSYTLTQQKKPVQQNQNKENIIEKFIIPNPNQENSQEVQQNVQEISKQDKQNKQLLPPSYLSTQKNPEIQNVFLDNFKFFDYRENLNIYANPDQNCSLLQQIYTDLYKNNSRQSQSQQQLSKNLPQKKQEGEIYFNSFNKEQLETNYKENNINFIDKLYEKYQLEKPSSYFISSQLNNIKVKQEIGINQDELERKQEGERLFKKLEQSTQDMRREEIIQEFSPLPLISKECTKKKLIEELGIIENIQSELQEVTQQNIYQLDEINTQIFQDLNQSFKSSYSDSDIQQKRKQGHLRQQNRNISIFQFCENISGVTEMKTKYQIHSTVDESTSLQKNLIELNTQLNAIQAKQSTQENAICQFIKYLQKCDQILQEGNLETFRSPLQVVTSSLDSIQKKQFQCKFCNKIFFKSCSLGGHISRVHKGKSDQYKEKQKIREKREMERQRKIYFKQKGQFTNEDNSIESIEEFENKQKNNKSSEKKLTDTTQMEEESYDIDIEQQIPYFKNKMKAIEEIYHPETDVDGEVNEQDMSKIITKKINKDKKKKLIKLRIQKNDENKIKKALFHNKSKYMTEYNNSNTKKPHQQ